jgi:hypothetical protein
MYIVGFNGPPQTGKDTAAGMLYAELGSRGYPFSQMREESLSHPLRAIAYAMVNYKGFAEGEDYERFKIMTFNLGGRRVSGRQLLQDASERFLKPVYGETIMADLFRQRNESFYGILLIRDCGFQIEVDPLIEFAGAENVVICKMMRKGYTFEGDTREEVHHPLASHNIWLSNGGGLDDLRDVVSQLCDSLIDLGWRL